MIPIDLGERGVILALLDGSQWAFDMLLIAQEDVGFSAIGQKKTYWPDTGEFSKPQFPRGRILHEEFAILKDRNDPSTLEVFGFDEFERFVGKGVTLKRLTFELVSPGLQFSNFIDWLTSGARLDYLRAVPVTTGILEKFPWMDCGKVIVYARNLSPGRNPDADRLGLTCGSFWKTH